MIEFCWQFPENIDAECDKWQDVNVVSSLLKLFFRKLPDSLITDGTPSKYFYLTLNIDDFVFDPMASIPLIFQWLGETL